MILGALVDAGLEKDFLYQELLKITTKFKIQITKTKRHKIQGTHVRIITNEEVKQRKLSDILSIIKNSKLAKDVKTLSSKIFRRLAEAEAKVHGLPINKVHFHEVGAIDAIVDVVGTCVGIEKMGIKKIYCSPLPQGKGEIEHKGGLLPNPAPATAELLKNIPTYGTEIQGELVTPTGAAIIAAIADDFGFLPKMRVEHIGYGAGTRNLSIPNFLRIFIGEAEIPTEHDTILQIEANIDDLNPRFYHKAINQIMKAGALDACIIPILMKKKRTGITLSILCRPEDKDRILAELFNQTTTLGARVYLVPREKLSRKLVRIKTKYGTVRVKLGFLGKSLKTVIPESEDYQKILAKHKLSTL